MLSTNIKKRVLLPAAALGILGAVIGSVAWAQNAATAFESSIALLADDWEVTSSADVTGYGEGVFRCAADQVMVGVKAPSFDAGAAEVRCAWPSVKGEPAMSVLPIEKPTKSAWLIPTEDTEIGHECGVAPVIATTHVYGEYPALQVRCAGLVISAKAVDQTDTGVLVVEAAASTWTWIDVDNEAYEFQCPTGSAITGRNERGLDDVHGRPFAVGFQCTTWKAVTK